MLASLAFLAVSAAAPAPVSAPISNIRYDVSFTRELASRRHLGVSMEFDVTGSGDVVLSLPAWTPGAYEMTWFARWVSGFTPTADGKALGWDKLDYDTWRIRPAGARRIRVAFEFQADSLDNAMAWSRADFAFFNGTNVFLYPDGRSLDFPATVRIHTESDWRVATGMHAGPDRDSFGEKNFHDLVDMPFFVGRFDLDSAQVGGINARLASYPAGQLAGAPRAAFWEQYRTMFSPEAKVFGETPFASYTTLVVFDSGFGGGSALEHQNSHLGIYTPEAIGQLWFASITAHEIIHAWNVKRLRPAEMVPYRYDAPAPTPWLWVSEGITDYYADLVLTRGGVMDSTGLLAATTEKILTVDNTVPVALEDASLSTWVHPTDGTSYIYYPKGSLAGFLLDILIRDASDNRRSLDEVMQELYRTTFKAGRGFGGNDWWNAVRRAASGRDFGRFNERYIDGREPFPWDSILPLAGLRLVTDTTRMPRFGIQTQADSAGVRVTDIAPDGAGAAAGLRIGDVILQLADISVTGEESFVQFRARYAGREGENVPIRVQRGGEAVTLTATIRLSTLTTDRLTLDPTAGPKALRIRHGLFAGKTGS
jgi:predicted metalloprotease with PDZ domain